MAIPQKQNTLSISVVIGTYNRPEMLQNLLQQLKDFSEKISLEVLVFDQSSEENYKKNRAHFPKKNTFHLIRMEKPNTCKYLNMGWQKAQSSIILYLDDDVTLTEKTLTAHINSYKNSQIQAVAGRVINDGEIITENSVVGKIKFFGAEILKNFSYEKKTYVYYPYGCNMSFRKSVLKEMDGFDEGLQPPIYAYNEVDLGVRITQKWKNSMIFEPDALVYHHQFRQGGTRAYDQKKIQNSIEFNYGYFVGKNYNLLQNIVCFIRRLPFQLIKEPEKIPSILQGYFHAKKKLFNAFNLSLIFVFLTVAILRLWRVGDFFSFNFDEEYQANLAWSIVKNFHIKWIGVSASNINYYLGPGFTYLNWFLFKLSNGDPIILGYFSAVWGIITTGSVYYIVKDLYGKKSAVCATLIYGSSAFLIFYDRRFWNPTLIPFISIWMFYSLVKVQKNAKWFLLTAVLFAASFHVHLSLMLFFPLILLSVIRNIKKISWTTGGGSLGLYLIITSPLIVFDFVHNFDNFLAPLRFLKADTELNQSFDFARLIAHFDKFLSVLGKIWFTQLGTNIQEEHTLGPHLNQSSGIPILIFLSVLILVWFIWKYHKNFPSQVLLASIGVIAAGFIFYPGTPAEYFMLGILALFPIIIGIFLADIPTKLSIPIGILFVMLNGAIIFTSTQPYYGLTVRKTLVKNIMSDVKEKTFYLETVGKDPRKYHPYGGWRHLFRVYGKTPTQSNADEFFGWIFPEELTDKKPELRVLISEDIPYKTDKKILKQFRSGAYYGYIFVNK